MLKHGFFGGLGGLSQCAVPALNDIHGHSPITQPHSINSVFYYPFHVAQLATRLVKFMVR